MISGTLIHQHTVIAFRNAHDVVAACSYEQSCQVLDIILVCLHVVRVACVTSHRNTGQLAHEVVLKTCTGNLLGIVQILRSDESYYCIYKERLETLSKAIASCLHGNLIPSVVCFR